MSVVSASNLSNATKNAATLLPFSAKNPSEERNKKFPRDSPVGFSRLNAFRDLIVNFLPLPTSAFTVSYSILVVLS